MAQQQPTQTAETPHKKSGFKKILIISLILLIVAGAATTTYIMFFKDSQGTQKEVPKDIFKFQMQTFTVNLVDMDYRRFLRVEVTLEYGSKDLRPEIEEKRHRVRDMVINILRGKSVSDLDTLEETDALRTEIRTAINKILTEGEIRGIYFNDFIIQ